ncbi:hypothetical protein WN55_03326 [Dufourea novaeangliae]|uniref:Uncharacterized protein n=1 Tax=Dufourea novaeangliae TaxID=178035 RepID=A0A154PL65_DUFNO|nr:hypothetical protein WN55_03326 [Dufourea novaeangliae]
MESYDVESCTISRPLVCKSRVVCVRASLMAVEFEIVRISRDGGKKRAKIFDGPRDLHTSWTHLRVFVASRARGLQAVS